MFLGSFSFTKRRPLLLLRHLQLPKSHACVSSNLRARFIKARADDPLFFICGTKSQHTIAQVATDLQYQHSFPAKPTFRAEEKSTHPNSCTSGVHQEDGLQQNSGFDTSRPSVKKGSPGLAVHEISSLSPSCKTLRRKSIAEKTRKHKENKYGMNQRLKYRGMTSENWRIPFAVLEENSPAEDVEPKERVSARAVWSLQRPKLRQIHVDQIKRPPIWSEFTFCNYVEDLASSSVDRLIQRRLYAEGDSHTAAVSRRLEDIFSAPSPREFLSPRAFNIALSFFYRTGNVRKAMALFVYMEWLRMEIPPDTVSIILQGTAAYKDLHNFTRLLRMFTSRGIAPTARSWTALVQAVQSREAQAVIIQSMRKRNMLENISIMREVVRLVIREDITKHLNSDLDLASFLASMDTEYGTEWLSDTAGNIILHEIGKRKPAIEAFETLDTLRQRGMLANVVTLNTLLHLCSGERNHRLAINVLQLLQVVCGVNPDENTFESLFMQAWRSRLYNFARVIWRCACTAGVTTSRVRMIVASNLLYNKPHSAANKVDSRAQIWSLSAAEVIVGINPAFDLDSIFAPCLGREGRSLNKATRRARTALIAEDLATAGQYRLVGDLPSMLEKALELDRGWMQNGHWKAKTPQWKRRWALPVQLEENR